MALVGRELLLRDGDENPRIDDVGRGHCGAGDNGYMLRPADDAERADQVDAPGPAGKRRGVMAG